MVPSAAMLGGYGGGREVGVRRPLDAQLSELARSHDGATSPGVEERGHDQVGADEHQHEQRAGARRAGGAGSIWSPKEGGGVPA